MKFKKRWISVRVCQSAVQYRLQDSHCITDGIKFIFNDIITFYKKNDSDER